MTPVKQRYNQIKKWFEKYERVLIPATLVFGVVVDYVTFASIQIVSAFALLFAHAFFAGAVEAMPQNIAK